MNPIVKKFAINFGLLIAALSIAYSLIAYVSGPEMMTNWWAGILMIFVSIGLTVFAVSKARSEMGGFISFRDAFSTYFLTMFIATALSTLFAILLMNVVDPGYAEEVRQLTMDKTLEMMEKFGTPEEAIEKAMQDMEDNNQFSAYGQFKGFLMTLMLGAVIGLIVGAIMKKNNPEVEG
jgi:hypothetical protein